jgi:hypothetical protein
LVSSNAHAILFVKSGVFFLFFGLISIPTLSSLARQLKIDVADAKAG